MHVIVLFVAQGAWFRALASSHLVRLNDGGGGCVSGELHPSHFALDSSHVCVEQGWHSEHRVTPILTNFLSSDHRPTQKPTPWHVAWPSIATGRLPLGLRLGEDCEPHWENERDRRSCEYSVRRNAKKTYMYRAMQQDNAPSVDCSGQYRTSLAMRPANPRC